MIIAHAVGVKELSSILFRFNGLMRAEDARRESCVRPVNLA